MLILVYKMYLLTGSVLMKKLGYTLAELLITLGIIGGISALIIPAIVSSMPDENKTMYLKTYDTLSETIQALASNSQIYPVCDAANNVDCSENPLYNLQLPLISPFKDDAKYSGETKLCNLLAYSLNASNVKCSSSEGTPNEFDSTSDMSFTTPNGMEWKVFAEHMGGDTNIRYFGGNVYIDINGTKGNNCFYNSNTCKNPDRFSFNVLANGGVLPTDAMGVQYIETRRSLLKKQYSISEAVRQKALSNVSFSSFEYHSCN